MNKPDSQNDIYTSFIKDVKDYVQLNCDLLRLNLIEKLSLIIALILSLFVCALLIITAMVYFSIAFVHWTGDIFESLIPGFLILGGVFLVLFLVFFLLRKRLFVNPIIKLLSSIIFKEPKNKEKDEEK